MADRRWVEFFVAEDGEAGDDGIFLDLVIETKKSSNERKSLLLCPFYDA